MLLILFISVRIQGQTKLSNDSIVNIGEEKNNRNVMLNASEPTRPREVAIGIPIANVPILENGLPVVYAGWPNLAHHHWRGDVSLSRVALTTLAESAITLGDLGYGVSSFTETGGDSFSGKMNYAVNQFGMQRVEMNISGEFLPGYSYSIGNYQNFDPGSFDLEFTNYVDRTQLYRVAMTHFFDDGKGSLSVAYKHVSIRSLFGAAQYSPFIYDGDGGVDEIPGFKIGRDSYVPIDGRITYMDTRTGEERSASYYDVSSNKANEVALYFDYKLGNGVDLSVKAKYVNSSLSLPILAPTNVRNGTFRYEQQWDDREATWTGDVHQRLALLNMGEIKDAFLTVELSKKTSSHDWRIGINEWHNSTDYVRNSAFLWHTVEPNPRKVIVDGGDPLYNVAAEYIDGSENKLALYFTDNWRISPKLRVYYGARIENFRLSADRLPFTRYPGFHVGGTDPSGQVVTTEEVEEDAVNMAFSASLSYNITNSFGLTGEATYLRRNRQLLSYFGQEETPEATSPVTLGRLGIFFNHPKFSVVSALTYATRKNDFARLDVPSPSGTGTMVVPAVFGQETMGWTTDVVIKPFEKFELHLLLTLQDPKYSDYDFQAFGEVYDYSDNVIRNQSKILIEIDPSYQISQNLRAWASFRYFGKQYANVGNSLFFEARWETFFGFNYKVNDFLSFNATIINLLDNTGASGEIPGTQLSTGDSSAYAGRLLAGTSLIPRTFSLTGSIKF
ncbi:MAG: TonB-dependent receptor [Labilibaculum sp.]|nr:TonB-dependent receptor [Labilibaculum sp.]